jgi:hypothetical protein
MTLIVERQPRREHAYEPRKRSVVWRFLKRYQLVELLMIISGICLVWLEVVLRSGQLWPALCAARSRFSKGGPGDRLE